MITAKFPRLSRLLNRLSAPTGFALAGIAAWGITCAGLFLQHWNDLHPCPLCIFQRLLFMVFGTLALLAALLCVLGHFGKTGKRLSGAILTLPCVLCLGVAIYQTLMQSFPGIVSECGRADPGLIEDFVDWFGLAWMENAPLLPELFFASGQCSSKEWIFLELSLANWSAVCSFSLAAFVLWVSFRTEQR